MTTPDRSEYLVLTPAGAPEPSLAIAATRAGGLGILNLEMPAEPSVALAALAHLEQHAHGPFGVLLDGTASALLESILDKHHAGLETLVLTPSGLDDLGEMVALAHASGLQVLLQATSLQEARLGEAAGVDGLIAKGHEAAGWVGEETTFVLLQRLLTHATRPVWAQGGIGRYSVAACFIAGAAGVVLDSQLLLTRESPLPEAVKARLRVMDGSETACIGSSARAAFRAYARPGLTPIQELRRLELGLTLLDQPADAMLRSWRQTVTQRVDWHDTDQAILSVGQDAVFAASLARQFGTVSGVLKGLRASVIGARNLARAQQSLAEGSPLAQSHQTRYPIVQGPMTRVSDQAAFAESVAAEGALPFLALALMRGAETRALLEETKTRLRDRSWGVGILGFVPAELRAEQLAAIRDVRPPYALIAGGRPDQARSLEAVGIPTYLHVPSPGLLRMFLEDGARRFVFEGRECGGHVGPRTSFVLWQSMIEVLLEHLPRDVNPADCHVLFAGGIHDGLSSAMVAALAAPLVARGVRIGVLLGTAYLFTHEAVEGGAIVEGFQQAAVASQETVLLESGPGQATRCLPTPFAEAFDEEKKRLVQSALPNEELKDRLEELNIGRLRIASKGVDRNPRFGQDPTAPKLVRIDPADQWQQGMYMIGQVAALRDRVCSMAELHADVSNGSVQRVAAWQLPSDADDTGEPIAAPVAVAIVGMGTILPGAPDLPAYWRNILDRVDSIREVPANRWDWRLYYDEDPATRDKVYSRWGGFIDPVPFDPLSFGMPPGTLPSIEPAQLLTLSVVRAALRDAGYLDRPFPRERTSVILGAGGGAGDLSMGYMTRTTLPSLFGADGFEIAKQAGARLPEWTEDSFAGILMNVAAGRVANRFDLGGVNYTVDAACASSLAAVYAGVRELQAGTSDVSIVGGLDALQNPFVFLCFAKTHALSPNGKCSTFDAEGDGIAISEGFAALVLKRLDDAERDGDRIYAVIRAAAGSSDGRDKGLTAPRPEGQKRALRRAYRQAGFSPSTVGLFEAHGTGTVVGDMTEVNSLSSFLDEAGPNGARAAVGSVKSLIGHTKASAGVAGLVKVALSLHHKVLPATINVKRPNPKANFAESSLYVNTETRPWLRRDNSPRRAAVSSFGFGGTNFHVVVEEYGGNYLPDRQQVRDEWPAELCVWRGRNRAEVIDAARHVLDQLERGARPRLRDLAYSLALQSSASPAEGPRLVIVATSLDELRQRLQRALDSIQSGGERQHDATNGIHWAATPLADNGGKVAFLFPGQGSQYVNMTRDLAVLLPEAREAFERADATLGDRLGRPLSEFVFPEPVFTDEDRQRQQQALTETNVAQPALGAAGLAMLRVLETFGIEPAMVAGHSYGELIALCAAGVFGEEDLLRLSEARGRFIREGAAGGDAGTMAAIEADADSLRDALAELPGIVLANLNAPDQTVISGSRPDVEKAVALCAARGLNARLLPVACAFHSPLVAPAQQRLAEMLGQVQMQPARVPVYSNTTGAPYPTDPDQIADILAEHLTRPVEWASEVAAMYDDGARIFVEVGPRGVLSGLVGRTLSGRTHACAVLDQSGRAGLPQLLQGLAVLIAEGAPVQLERVFESRNARSLPLDQLERETGLQHFTPTTWLVDGGRAWPASTSHTAPAPLGPLQFPLPFLNHEGEPSMSQPHSNGHVPEPVSTAQVGRPPGAHNALVAVAPAPAPVAPALPPDEPSVATSEPAGLVAASADAVVIQHFQQVMQRFLDTQTSVMLAYFDGAGRRPQSLMQAQPALPRLVAPAPTRPALPASPRMAPPAPPRMAPSVPAAPPPPLVTAPARQPAPTITPPTTNGDVHAAVAPPIATVAPAPAPAPAAAPPSHAWPSRKELSDRLLGVVSDRTGYPADMLGLDVDLEADLGIDSIKRVEIVGTLVRTLALPDGAKPEMEKLTASRTLGRVLDLLTAHLETLGSNSAGGANRPFEQAPADRATVGRLALQVVDAPLAPGAQLLLAPAGVVVVIDDEAGVGEALASHLLRLGRQVVRVLLGSGSADGVDLALGTLDSQAARALVDDLRARHGPVAALVHLAGLRPVPAGLDLDHEAWRSRLRQDLLGLHLLVQALWSDLEQAGANGGGAILAATALGGAFGLEPSPLPWNAGDGALAGYLKSLAQETAPGVRVKSVDMTPATAGQLSAQLLAELAAADGLVEVGYQGTRRVRLDPVQTPLAGRSDAEPKPLEPGAVVLVTGGARGITAEAALALAGAGASTLIVLGRTSDSDEEPPEVNGLEAPVELRRALIAVHQRTGLTVTPAAIERMARDLIGRREVRRNLERLRAAGAQVEYIVCDVRDAAAFGRAIDQAYARHGRIDGVIHGAGTIEDKLVQDKTVDSFERVLATKVDSALTLAAHLRPETLRFVALFSSIAARLGNRGQADYAAASEVLNKLAQQWDRRWPTTRVVSFNWGPWLATGMVSPEVQRQFAARGVVLIPLADGLAALLDELRLGRKGEVELVIGGWSSDSAVTAQPTYAAEPEPIVGQAEQHALMLERLTGLPLLARHTQLIRVGEELELLRLLSVEHDRYLDHHRMDGRAVLPLAFAMELMAEAAAAAGAQDQVVTRIRSIRLLKGVVLPDDGQQVPVRVVARPRTEGRRTHVDVIVGDPARPALRYYQATVELGVAESGRPAGDSGLLALAGPTSPLAADEAYARSLFHGPMLHAIESINAIGPGGARALMRPSAPAQMLADADGRAEWLLDPVFLDAVIQLQLVWARMHWDVTSLPVAVHAYSPLGALQGESPRRVARDLRESDREPLIRCEMRLRPESTAPISHADFFFFAPDGQLVGRLEDLEMAGSATLNRVTDGSGAHV